MSNPYYSPTGNPATGAQGLSAIMRAEFTRISTAFDLMPPLVGAGLAIVIDASGTRLVPTAGTLALTGAFATTGDFSTTLVQGASTVLTLPTANGTLATTAGITSAVAAEATARAAGDTTNATAISTEATRATTAEALLAPKASPTLTGTPTAPTAGNGTNTTQIATTAFVQAAAAAGGVVTSVAGRTGAVVLANSDVSGSAPLASPGLTGNPTAPTQATLNNSTRLATTAYTDAAVAVETAARLATGWKTISTTTFSSVSTQTIHLPTSSYRRFRITLQNCTVSSTGNAILGRVSFDDGATFQTSSTYAYVLTYVDTSATQSYLAGTTGAGFFLTSLLLQNIVADGTYELWPGSVSQGIRLYGTVFCVDSAGQVIMLTLSGAFGTVGLVNAIQLLLNIGGTMSGTVILEGLV